MKVSATLAAALSVAVSTALSVPSAHQSRDNTDGLTESPDLAELLKQAQSNVIDQVNEQAQNLTKRGVQPSCTADKLVFRRE
jgi:tyrosinase